MKPSLAPLCFAMLVYLLSLNASAADPEAASQLDYPPAMAELTLTSEGQRMPALMYMAKGAGPHPTVVLLHGFPGNERNLDIAQDLRRNGFNVLFFHYRGAWGADGNYSILNARDDVAAALAYLRDEKNANRLRVDTGKLSLLGHSMGGFLALAAASRDTALVCTGAISPANVGLVKLGVDTEDRNSLRILHYADTLFMLKGYDSQVMLQELRSADLPAVDLRAMGPALKGKSVFLIVGDKDPVTPAETMLLPVAAAYRDVEGLSVQHHVISGDHAFSGSRLLLTDHVRQWLLADCR